jgi:hypothetical protein
MSAVSMELGVAIGTLTQSRLKAAAGPARGAGSGPFGETVTSENDRLKRDNKALRQQLEFAKKKTQRPSSRETKCKVQLYRAEKAYFPIEVMCRVLKVSTSGFYA